ncbi:MAG: response regulator [Bacteroidetes bacterium]|uniref:Response regulator n=1 Tax=Candidatus Chlorohelix allophototropha TaxID=3003348 RepID=A0A8T7M2U2_9CHLR|nr:response regulator [Chloroflexota bacterium]NWJ53143.1 response regulator [Bacteroidota bacterium]WJW65859.1 response regulator [Chloroflexota bacterium L227-S17]
MMVLIVNNDHDFRNIVRIILKPYNYDVVEAVSYNDGFWRAVEFKPQIVLVDNIITSKSGIDLCKDIQLIPGMEATEFLVFTDFDNELEKVVDSRIIGVIKKPYILFEMRKILPFPSIQQQAG